MHKFLVIQTASLGDVIIATALLEKLHECYPAAALDLLVQKGAAPLFEGHPYLNRLYAWDKKHHKLANMRRLIRDIRREEYDVTVNVQRYAATGWISLRSGAKHIIGFDKNPFARAFDLKVPHEISATRYVYEADRNQRLIEGLTDAQAATPRLYPSESDYDAVYGYKEQAYITISPSSLWFTKQFPKEQWMALIRRISAPYRIYLLGSPKEQALGEEIRKACPDKEVYNLCGSLSLLQSAALMQDAAVNFTNDSAPLHLGAAVGAQVTAVFCSTVKEFGFAPRGENIRIVETQTELPCRPCGLHGHRKCPEKHFRCAWDIDLNQLLNTVPPWNKH
ncbi:MAG: glycosyltransferase family 9 protein [Bacteroidales bacterium]|nr:glycosyltransferase family 9 protein [Bacteroidales bacterium]